MRRAVRAMLIVLAVWFLSSGRADSPATNLKLTPRLRRPVAVALADHGRWLFVANQAGSISVIDTHTRQIIKEVDIGKKLTDLAATPDSRQLVAVDEGADELLLVDHPGPDMGVAQRLPVAGTPVSVRLTRDGARCFVACLWSHELSIIDLRPTAHIVKTIVLPFAPRQQVLVSEDKKLIVADSFGGRLAVIDAARGELACVRTIPGHNIRGLTLSRDGSELLIAHQTLYSLAQTTFDDVHWGNLITNNLRVLRIDNVLSAKADVLKGQRLHYLGDVGNGAGDPAQLAISPTGKVIVALGGVGDILLGNEKDYHWQRLRVGRHPVAVVIASEGEREGERAYVANRFADSIAVVDLQKTTATAEISLGPQRQLSARDRGEMLFYDARLAHDGWLSCHSCHSDGHSNGSLTDNLGDGSFGAPKRILSLLGVGDTAPYAWLGTMPDLESQIQKSILTTMHGPKPSPQQVRDLAAFLRTLRPPPAMLKFAVKHDSAALERGRAVFHKQACSRCHTPPEYTSPSTYDVGFRDAVGNTRFNPPSLRGVSQGGPYFHDNRAASLEEVISKYRHQLKNELTKQERDDLLKFLRAL